MSKAAAPKDELDAILGSAPSSADPADVNLDDPIDSFDQEFATELDEPELGDYDLSTTQRLDFRVLQHRKWYGAEIFQATQGNSKAGNPQIEFVLKVTEGCEPNEQAEGAPVQGICVYVWAATPRPPLDKKKIQSLWTLKDIAGAVGLADFLPNGEVKCVKKGVKAGDFVGRKLRFRNLVDAQYNTNEPRNKADAFAAPRA